MKNDLPLTLDFIQTDKQSLSRRQKSSVWGLHIQYKLVRLCFLKVGGSDGCLGSMVLWHNEALPGTHVHVD